MNNDDETTVHGPMRRRRFLETSALGAVGVSLGLSASSVAEARVGGRPPSFELPAVPGAAASGRFRMRDHLGEDPVVILFWATWCAPCRQELPVYQSLYARYHERGLTVVAISMDNASTLPSAGPMARRLGLTFPVLSDLDTQVTTQMNPRKAAPFSMWVDRRGIIVREREGFSLDERAEIVRGVARLVRSDG